jgi:hypothetical protein
LINMGSSKVQARSAAAGSTWAADLYRAQAATAQQRRDEQVEQIEQQHTVRALATTHGEAFLDAIAAELERAAEAVNAVAGARVVQVFPREAGEACHLEAQGAKLGVQPDYANLEDLFLGLRVFMRCHGCDDLSPRPFRLTPGGDLGLLVRGYLEPLDAAAAARAIFTQWMQTAHIGGN